MLVTLSEGVTNNYRYTGQQWDPDLRMYFLRARYLNPNIGRFCSTDNYGGAQNCPQTLHKYAYCHLDPVNLTDPSGLAVYFVRRKLSMPYGKYAYKLASIGHGYLLFTVPADPGTDGDPLTHGWGALTTFSWHPNSWDYADSQSGYDFQSKTPGRVWEHHSDDMHPSSYSAYLITANPSQQTALLNAIHSWIDIQRVGYDKGNPIPDPDNPKNDIGALQHRAAPEDCAYYSLMEQNCVWWATIMLMQNNIQIPKDAQNAITSYNLGGGAATQVINGRRSAFAVHSMRDLAEGMVLPGGCDIDVGNIRLTDGF